MNERNYGGDEPHEPADPEDHHSLSQRSVLPVCGLDDHTHRRGDDVYSKD
jgi:hypothetical protein